MTRAAWPDSQNVQTSCSCAALVAASVDVVAPSSAAAARASLEACSRAWKAARSAFMSCWLRAVMRLCCFSAASRFCDSDIRLVSCTCACAQQLGVYFCLALQSGGVLTMHGRCISATHCTSMQLAEAQQGIWRASGGQAALPPGLSSGDLLRTSCQTWYTLLQAFSRSRQHVALLQHQSRVC